MSSSKNIARDMKEYSYSCDYDIDHYNDYDEVYVSSNKGTGGGGRQTKSRKTKGGFSVYSSKHTRLQSERNAMSKTNNKRR